MRRWLWLAAARNHRNSTREPCGTISTITSGRRRLCRRSLLPKHPPNSAQVEKVHPADCRGGERGLPSTLTRAVSVCARRQCVCARGHVQWGASIENSTDARDLGRRSSSYIEAFFYGQK